MQERGEPPLEGEARKVVIKVLHLQMASQAMELRLGGGTLSMGRMEL